MLIRAVARAVAGDAADHVVCFEVAASPFQCSAVQKEAREGEVDVQGGEDVTSDVGEVGCKEGLSLAIAPREDTYPPSRCQARYIYSTMARLRLSMRCEFA
jgi:hypothetical protein